MKICFFVGYYPLLKGGAEYQASLLAEKISKNDSVFFISIGHEKDEVKFIDGIKVYMLSFNSFFNKMLLYYPLNLKIIKILDSEKPDIIYQRILNSFSFHLSKYTNRRNIPFYLHIADKYCLEFPFSISGIIRKFFFNNIIRTKTQFIIQTDEQKRLLSSYSVNPILKIYNLHPSNSNTVLNDNLDLKKEIIWIGSARKIKQMELFIDLADSFVDDYNLTFSIIGRLELNAYGQKLHDRINLSKNINYYGEQDNSFVNDKLSKAYLLVNTSVSEGFSNTFVQAWLRGIPVLSLNSDPDNLLQKRNFGVFCQGNFALLIQSIKELLEDNSKYNQIRSNCLIESEMLFSIDKNINKFVTVLKSNSNEV